MKRWTFRIEIAFFLFTTVFAFAQSPPSNDDFTNRTVLTGSSVIFSGTLQNATLQSGEPTETYYARVQDASVWWSWTAGSSDPATIEVLNFSTNAFQLGAIDVWTGTNWSSDFNFVAGIPIDIGRHPFLTFSATAGTTYQLRVIGTNYGNFTLKITQTNPPIIVVQPFSRTISVGGSVFFGVVAAGNPPFSYQWQSNGVTLPGETFPIISMDNLTTNQSAAYSVVVSNGVSGTVSATAILNVTNVTKPPKLIPIGSSNGHFSFGISGDLGRLYRIQSSTNLFTWQEENNFPTNFIYYDSYLFRKQNGLVYANQNHFSVPQPTQQKLYRTLNYVPSLAVCINNLGKIRFAKEIWTLETKNIGLATPAGSELAGYLKGGLPFCPLDSNQNWQTSYRLDEACDNPQCLISTNHVLEEPEY